MVSFELPPPSYDQIHLKENGTAPAARTDELLGRLPAYDLSEKLLQQAYRLKQHEQTIYQLEKDLERANAEVEKFRLEKLGSGGGGVIFETTSEYQKSALVPHIFLKGAGASAGSSGKGGDKSGQRTSIGVLRKVLAGFVCCFTFLLMLAACLYIVVVGGPSVPFGDSPDAPKVEQFTVVGATKLGNLCWARALVNGYEKWCVLHRAPVAEGAGNADTCCAAGTGGPIRRRVIDDRLICTLISPEEATRQASKTTRPVKSALRAKPPTTFRRRTMIVFSGMGRWKRNKVERRHEQSNQTHLFYWLKEEEIQKADSLCE